MQAGGHAGQFPVHLARKFDFVYTWEPFGPDFAHLIHNLAEAGVADTVFAARGFLGESPGRADLRFCGSGSNKRDRDAVSGLHPVYRLDDLDLPECDLIYLDVEGDELPILRGAPMTLERCKPVVAAEERAKFAEVGALASFLGKFGYKQVGAYCSDLIFKVEEK